MISHTIPKSKVFYKNNEVRLAIAVGRMNGHNFNRRSLPEKKKKKIKKNDNEDLLKID